MQGHVVGLRLLLAGCGKTLWGRRISLICTSRITGVHHAGCSKRPSSKAAASEEARRTLRYVEPLSAARTPLADFFSILLDLGLPFLDSRVKARVR